MEYEIGCRVGAARSADAKKVYLFGYGVYQGREQHPALGFPNPKILLDNGEVVWGCECWWGPEERFNKEFIKDREVEIVPIRRHPEGYIRTSVQKEEE